MSTEYGYFSGLFSSLLKAQVLQEIWAEAIHATGRGDASAVLHHAVYLAAAKLEDEEEDEDYKLACRVQKAERRREAKRRNKERKKKSSAGDGVTSQHMHSASMSMLPEQDRELYLTVCDVLGDSRLLYDESVLINAVLDCGGNANVAIEKLMFEERSGDSAGMPADSSTSYKDEDNGSSPRSPASPVLPSLPTLRSSHLSAEQLSNLQPLLNHCVHHLRSRNPGIQVALDQDCLVYKGTQRPLARTDNPSELLIEIDLHGLTRKPAVDVLQSSLLYYHSILGTKALDAMCSREECAVAESSSSRKTGSASSLSTTVKGITVLYVVGQGIHSPGAVPILRNTFMRELESFWSVFEHGIDAANEGQVFVKVRKLK